MTISNTSRTAGPFIGNGVTTDFPFSFKIFSRDDLLVAQTVTATGVETIKAIDADFTVLINSDQNSNPGGVIHMLVAPPVGATLAATSNITLVQSLDLTNQGGFYPKVINDAMDRMVIMIQQLSAKIGLSSLNVGAAAAVSSVLSFIANLSAPTGVSLVGSATWYADTVIGFNAAKVPDGAVIIFSGRAAPRDGGGGTFVYSKNSVQAADNGLVFTPAGGGRLFREGWTATGFTGALSPRFFGAKGDGAADDYSGLQAVVTAALSFGGAQTIDLAGATWLTSLAVVYPAGGNVTMVNGTIKATAAFPANRFLVEVASQSGGLVHHDLSFNSLTLDANRRGGCLLVDNCIRISITACRALHFTTVGFQAKKTIDAHEVVYTGCFAFEFLYGEPGFTGPYTGIGFDIQSFDNHLTDCISYITGTSLRATGQYTLFKGCHFGSMYLPASSSNLSFSQCYFDGGPGSIILIENPWHTEFIGCRFLTNTTDATYAFVTLKPMGLGQYIVGFKLKGCTFHNVNPTMVKSIAVDKSVGSFTAGGVYHCYISENSFTYATEAYTHIKTSLYQSAATVWNFNLAALLPFGVVQHVLASYMNLSGPQPKTTITNIADTNVITITNSDAGNGTMFIQVDVNLGTLS